MIIKLDKELTREIFEEFPVVQDAYARYVPGVSLKDVPTPWSITSSSSLSRTKIGSMLTTRGRSLKLNSGNDISRVNCGNVIERVSGKVQTTKCRAERTTYSISTSKNPIGVSRSPLRELLLLFAHLADWCASQMSNRGINREVMSSGFWTSQRRKKTTAR